MSEVPTSDPQKRKLSAATAELGRSEPKRLKENDAASDAISVAATDGSEEEDDRDSASDTPTANLAGPLDGPGPFVFFCWADGIISLFDHWDEGGIYFTLKDSALEAWSHVSHLPKEDRSEALGDHIGIVLTWHVQVPAEEAPKTRAAQSMSKEWCDTDDEGSNEVSAGDWWWYEVEAQREKPDRDIPTLEIILEDEGIWWLTGIRRADTEGREAMLNLVNYLANE